MERGRGPRSVSELPSLVADEIKAIDADEEGGVPEVRATGGSKRRLLSHDGDSVSCFSRLEVKASNHGAKWTLVLIWTLVNIFVAAYGARFEAREDYRDLRAYTGPVGRGCGLLLDLNCSLLLLPMCRALITRLRGTAAATWLPFDDNITLHRVIAWVVAAATFGHIVCQGINYWLFYTKSWQDGWLNLKSVLVTGAVLTAILVAILVTALRCVRRSRSFVVFWNTHQLYVLFYLVLLLHGLRRHKPTYWGWFAVPGGMFVCDRLYRLCGYFRHASVVTAASCQPCEVVHIEVEKRRDYKCGQYFEIQICAIAPEWHPFTASSAPQSPTLTFDIKVLGDWTRALYQHVSNKREDFVGSEIMLRGPFGAPAQHAYQFSHVVLVSSGIGATPCASILKDMLAQRRERQAGRASDGQNSRASHVGVSERLKQYVDHPSISISSSEGTERRPLLVSSAAGASPTFSGVDMRRQSQVIEALRHLLKDGTSEWLYSGQCACTALSHHLPASVIGGHRHRPRVATGTEGDAVEVRVSDILRVSEAMLGLQRILRSVLAQLVVIWIFIIGFMLEVVILQWNSAYYITCILIDKLRDPTPVTDPWELRMMTTASAIFFAVSFILLAGILVDLWCVGFRRYFTMRCHVHEARLVVPIVLVNAWLVIAMSYEWVDVPVVIRFLVSQCSKILLIVAVAVRFRHLTNGLTYATPAGDRGDADAAKAIRSCKFVWINRELAAMRWLVDDVARLEATDVASDFLDCKLYVTRKPQYSGRSLSTEEANEAETLEAANKLRNGVTWGRPDFKALFQQFSEESWEPESIVGVFFCGAPALARTLQEVCVRLSHRTGATLVFKKENF